MKRKKFYYPVYFGNKLVISNEIFFDYADIYNDYLSYRLSIDFESLINGGTNMIEQSITHSANENNYHKTEKKKQYQFIIKPSNRDKLEKLVKRKQL